MKGKLTIGGKIKTKNTTLSEEEFEDQNPYIEEEQTRQWLKEKVQKNKTHKKTPAYGVYISQLIRYSR
jgi:hypothetical protein